MIRSIEKSNELIGNRTRDLPACSIVPQPTTLPRAPKEETVCTYFHSILKIHQNLNGVNSKMKLLHDLLGVQRCI
jgi:hypothetical protein